MLFLIDDHDHSYGHEEEEQQQQQQKVSPLRSQSYQKNLCSEMEQLCPASHDSDRDRGGGAD